MEHSGFIGSFFFFFFLMLSASTAANSQYLELTLPDGVNGPESLAFDCSNMGPYAGVSDGSIRRWQGSKTKWSQFATTTPSWMPRWVCDGRTDTRQEPLCGRPLGLKFNPGTCDLYIADAYFGLMNVGHRGGQAQVVASSAGGIPFRFTNALEIDPVTGIVYFTDSSMYYQRREHSTAIQNGDASGRFLQYDPRTRQVATIFSGLAFPNGVALSKDRSFILVAESIPMRLLKFWLHDGRVSYSYEIFAHLTKFPDNIETDADGNFWVALNTKRVNATQPNQVDPMGILFDVNGKVLKVVDGNRIAGLDSVSEIEEHQGYLYAGSPVHHSVVVFKAPS